MCDVVVGFVGVVSGGGGDVVSGGGEVVSGGDAVTMVADGQEPLPWNVTSARYVKVERTGRKNCREITGCTMISVMHFLTRESQDVMLGTGNVWTSDLAFSISAAAEYSELLSPTLGS